MPSKLFYFGSNVEVELGDRIEYRTLLLRHMRPGAVVCIPDKTALELADEGKDPEDWLIKFDDGTYTGWMYHPEELQPAKRLRFVSRADGDVEGISNAELERLDAEEAERGVVQEFIGCAVVILLLFIGLVALLMIF